MSAFAEAIQNVAERELLPTSLSSVELQQLSRDVRAKSLFSARTTETNYLEDIARNLKGLLQGKFNEATARAQLQDSLDSIEYAPEPGQAGTIRDLSSDERIRLVLETNLRQAANYGLKQQGEEPLALFSFPAWELIRIYPREVPRGILPNSMGWEARWIRAGGTLVEGERMIARKDDPIWENLGNSSLFEDGLDSSFPPYAFNSGMGWREVPRQECIDLGLISAEETPQPTPGRFFDENANGFTTDQLREILQGLRTAA